MSTRATDPAQPHAVHSDQGLAHGSMSQLDVMAQSVAGIAPSAAAATTPALIAIYAGRGAWLSYVCATVVVLLVGLVATQFGRRFASSGSLYSYVARGLGSGGAFAAGWGLVVGYAFIAMIGVVGTGIYFGSFLTGLGISASGTLATCIILVIAGIAAAAFAIVGIKISTRLGLVLEIISVTAVGIVIVTVLVKNGIQADQFSLSGLSFDGVTFGIVLAVLGFVGFESAASLGAEARNPHTAIPRAVLGSAALVGVLYIVAAYTMVLGFGGPDALTKSAAPMNDLADRYGLGGVAWIIDLGLTASFFAVTIACINAASRILYTMGEEDLLPRALGRAHPTHRTPHIAIGVIAPAVIVVPIIMVASGVTPLNVFAYTGTIGTFGYMLGYLLMAIALPFFLRRRDEFNPLSAVLAVVVVAALIYIFYKNVIPVPDYPLNLMPWIFLGLIVLGMAWYVTVRLRKPQVVEEAGMFEEEPVPEGTVHGHLAEQLHHGHGPGAEEPPLPQPRQTTGNPEPRP